MNRRSTAQTLTTKQVVRRPERRQHQLAETRQRIIEGARLALVDGGLEALNLRRIVRTVGVARSTIHCHFESRAGLLRAVLQDAFERGGFAFVEAAAATDDPVEALDLFIAQSSHMWAADYVIWRRLMALAALETETERVVSAWEERRYQLLLQLVQRLAESLEAPRGPSIHSVAGALWALTSYQAFERLLLATASEVHVIAILRRFARGLYERAGWSGGVPDDASDGLPRVSSAAMPPFNASTSSSVLSLDALAASDRSNWAACSADTSLGGSTTPELDAPRAGDAPLRARSRAWSAPVRSAHTPAVSKATRPSSR